MEQRYDDPSDELEQSELEAPEVDEQYDDEPQEPVLVRVRLNGKTIMVTEDVADAIQAREQDYQRQISKMGTELGNYRRQTEPEPKPQTPVQDDDLEFFTSPSQAVAKRIQDAEERAYRRMQEDRARETAQEKWWGKFYDDNKDLKGREKAVRFIINEHYDDLKDLDQAECHQELARLTNEFLGVETQTRPTKPLPSRQVVTERPSQTTTQARPRTAPEPDQAPGRPKFVGISAELARQAEARRKSRIKP